MWRTPILTHHPFGRGSHNGYLYKGEAMEKAMEAELHLSSNPPPPPILVSLLKNHPNILPNFPVFLLQISNQSHPPPPPNPLYFLRFHNKIMATLGSLSSLFENPMPENPTLLDSLSSWNQTKPKKPGENSSFTEIFGEFHFREKPAPTSEKKKGRNGCKCDSKSNGGFLVKNSESLQLCTEGLGSESSDDVDDLVMDGGGDWSDIGKEKGTERQSQHNGVNGGYSRSLSQVRSRSGGGFPPPISSIGKSGKPWISFKSYREDGRFVLREIRIPTHEFLQASREDGRLKLHIVHPEEAISEGDEGEREGEEEEEEKEREQEEEVEKQVKKIAGEGHSN